MFLDGVGLGTGDPDVDPFVATPTPALDAFAGRPWAELRTVPDGAPGTDGATVRALDARLAVAGLPQSATGQATLLSGRNAARAMGRHYGPWPGPTLHRFLEREGDLFARAAARHGADALCWAGASPPGYFRALERPRRPMRLNVPAWCAVRAGATLPDLDAYRRGEAVSADLDGAAFARLGAEPPGGVRPGRAGAEAAGRRYARLANERAVTFFDVWTTDRAGHEADRDEAVRLVKLVDAFVGGLLEDRPSGLTVVLTSDHGNLEDLSHGSHTEAPVPTVAWGPGADRFVTATSLLDVAAACGYGPDAGATG